MSFIKFPKPKKSSLIWTLVLFSIGLVIAFKLVPAEVNQLSWEVPGDREDYPFVYTLRPILIGIACFLPALAMLMYSFGQILDRYMARLLFSNFVLTTGIIFLIWLLGDFFENVDEIVSSDSPIHDIVRFYGNQLPMVGSLILPYSLMLAILWTLSMLSKNCEITSMIQSGRGLMRITMPVILFSFFVACYTTIFNYQWAPSANLYRRLTFNENARNNQMKSDIPPNPIIYKNEIDHRIWSVRYYSVLGDPTSPFKDVHVEQFGKPGQLTTDFFAESCVWNPGDKSWTFKNVKKRNHSETGIPEFEAEVIPEMNMPYRETPWLLITPGVRIDTRSVPDLVSRLEMGSLSQRDRVQYRTHKYLRFAQGFSTFVLALLAIPGGISFSRRASLAGVGTALGLSGCMIFGFEVFPSLASAGYFPPFLGAWLPNFIFMGIALYLFQTRISHKNLKDYYQTFVGKWKKQQG